MLFFGTAVTALQNIRALPQVQREIKSTLKEGTDPKNVTTLLRTTASNKRPKLDGFWEQVVVYRSSDGSYPLRHLPLSSIH
jgi:hypothetical protein